MLTEKRKDEIIKLCQDVVKIRSYSGEEKEVFEKWKNVLTSMGYDDIFVDDYGNIIGHIKGNREGKSILFDGHMDTVPVPDSSKWTQEPFGAEIVDGKIYGRGTSDMKGAMSAMVCAAVYFAEDTKRNKTL